MLQRSQVKQSRRKRILHKMDNNSYKLTKQIFEGVRDFDPAQTFECGQCFRWTREKDKSYSGIVNGHFANVSYNNEEDTITVWSNYMPESEAFRERFWRNYFDLDRDYSVIKKTLTRHDPIMEDAIEMGSGIRILNQEPWETLVSFLISQNSNIPRITGCIELLCKEFGEKIGRFSGRDLYTFPTMKKIATLFEADLESCKLGYRAKYLVETARQIDLDGGGLLAAGHLIETEKIEKYLLSLSGVGPKVAHCIMLFAMKKMEIFPIDVWMKRVMNRLYGIDEDNVVEMQAYAKEHFGEYGGIAQQYLFNYIRKENLIDTEEFYMSETDGDDEPAYLQYLEQDDEETQAVHDELDVEEEQLNQEDLTVQDSQEDETVFDELNELDEIEEELEEIDAQQELDVQNQQDKQLDEENQTEEDDTNLGLIT